jgi:hypothetical protein
MADPTPEEVAAAALAKAQKDAADAPAKAQLFAWLDEWADKRVQSAPPPKTNQPRPVSFLSALLGEQPDKTA